MLPCFVWEILRVRRLFCIDITCIAFVSFEDERGEGDNGQDRLRVPTAEAPPHRGTDLLGGAGEAMEGQEGQVEGQQVNLNQHSTFKVQV